MYIDKLDNIVNKYNNTYHSTIKMKPVDLNWSRYIDFNKESKKEDSKPKVDDHFQNTKTFLQYVTLQVCTIKFLWLEKLKILCRGYVIIVKKLLKLLNHDGKEIVKTFSEKGLQKTNQAEFRA